MGKCSSKVAPSTSAYSVPSYYVRKAIVTGSLRELRQYVARGYKVSEEDVVLAIKTRQPPDLVTFIVETNSSILTDQSLVECIRTHNIAVARSLMRWIRPTFSIAREAMSLAQWDMVELFATSKMLAHEKFVLLKSLIKHDAPQHVIDATWDIGIKYQKSMLETIATSANAHVWKRLLAIEPSAWFDLFEEFVKRDNAGGVLFMVTHRMYTKDVGRNMLTRALVLGSERVVASLETLGLAPTDSMLNLAKQACRKDSPQGLRLLAPRVPTYQEYLLILSCHHHSIECIRELLSMGVDPMCQNARGIRMCSERMQDGIAELLVQHAPPQHRARAMEIRQKFAVTN